MYGHINTFEVQFYGKYLLHLTNAVPDHVHNVKKTFFIHFLGFPSPQTL